MTDHMLTGRTWQYLELAEMLMKRVPHIKIIGIDPGFQFGQADGNRLVKSSQHISFETAVAVLEALGEDIERFKDAHTR